MVAFVEEDDSDGHSTPIDERYLVTTDSPLNMSLQLLAEDTHNRTMTVQVCNLHDFSLYRGICYMNLTYLFTYLVNMCMIAFTLGIVLLLKHVM